MIISCLHYPTLNFKVTFHMGFATVMTNVVAETRTYKDTLYHSLTKYLHNESWLYNDETDYMQLLGHSDKSWNNMFYLCVHGVCGLWKINSRHIGEYFVVCFTINEWITTIGVCYNTQKNLGSAHPMFICRCFCHVECQVLCSDIHHFWVFVNTYSSGTCTLH